MALLWAYTNYVRYRCVLLSSARVQMLIASSYSLPGLQRITTSVNGYKKLQGTVLHRLLAIHIHVPYNTNLKIVSDSGHFQQCAEFRSRTGSVVYVLQVYLLHWVENCSRHAEKWKCLVSTFSIL